MSASFNYPIDTLGCHSPSMMTQDIQRPLEGVTSCHDVPEHHDIVEPALDEFRPGHVLDGRFIIEEALSRSGMATIYKAKDVKRNNDLVAVKVPHLKLESDPAFFLRFQREEEIGLSLNHPYLLKFIPVEGKSRPYIVTEYLRGCTLAHLLNAMRPLPEKDALRITSLLCDALEPMHNRGIVHRDLKPGNVMICRDRTIRLMDFGVSVESGARRITLPGSTKMMGTPDYMAPEQVTNGHCDARTDVYCLGVVLFEMLTGSLPFQDENSWTALNLRVSGDPIAPRKLNSAISPEAEEIVLHAMQRNPENRYVSAAAFKLDLDFPSNVKITGYHQRLQTARRMDVFRRNPFVVGVGLGLAFILLQIVLFFVLRYFLKAH